MYSVLRMPTTKVGTSNAFPARCEHAALPALLQSSRRDHRASSVHSVHSRGAGSVWKHASVSVLRPEKVLGDKIKESHTINTQDLSIGAAERQTFGADAVGTRCDWTEESRGARLHRHLQHLVALPNRSVPEKSYSIPSTLPIMWSYDLGRRGLNRSTMFSYWQAMQGKAGKLRKQTASTCHVLSAASRTPSPCFDFELSHSRAMDMYV